MATVTSLFSGGGDNTYADYTGRFIVHNYYSGNLQPIAYPANVATYSGGLILNSHWSPNGVYLALSTNSGEVYVYYRGGNVLVRVDDGTLGSAAAPNGDSYYKIKWNHDGTSLAVASSASPYIKIWNFSANTFTPISGLPSVTSQVIDLAWNNNTSAYGSSIALGLTAAPRLRVWDRAVGTNTFTQLTNTNLNNAVASGICYSVGWSPSDLRLTAGKNASPVIAFIRRTGQNTWVNTNPVNLGFINIRAIAWNPLNGYVAMASDSTSAGSPGIFLYSHDEASVATYVRLANASPLPGGVSQQCYDVAWSPDGTLLAVASTSSPGLQIYNFDASASPPLSYSTTIASVADQKTVSWTTFNLPDIVVNDVFGNADISSAFSLTSAGGKLFLAGTTITSVFNTAQTADKLKGGSLTAVSTTTLTSTANAVKSAAVDMQAFDTVLYTGGRLQRGSVVILSSLTLSALSVRVKPADAILTSSTSLSADWNYDHNYVEVGYFTVDYVIGVGVVKPAEAALSTAASLTSTAAKVKNIISALTAAITLSATASRTARTTLTAVSAVLLTSSAAVIRSAAVALSAFNTVISAGGRIRPVVDLTDSQAILTASASRIRRGVISYTDPQAPTGIIVDSTHLTAIPGFYPPIGGDFTNNGVTNETPLAVTDIAFWIKNTSAQVIWSSTRIDGYASSSYTAYVFSYTGSGFSLVTKYVTSYGVDNNYPTVTTTLTWGGSLGAGWNHIYLHITQSTNTLYINGQSQGAGSGVSPGAMQLSQPIILGAEQRITGDPGSSSRNYDYVNTSSDFEIAQFWAGRATNSLTATPTAFYNETAAWTGSLGYYNLGADGHDGFNTTFDKVYFYSEFNYPYANHRLDTAGSRPTQYGANFLSTTATSDQSFIPGWTARTATTFADEIIPYYPARFRLFSQGGQIRGGALIANAAFALTTTPYNFTKAQAALSSAATLTARISYKKSADVSITASAAISATLTGLVSSELNISANTTLVVTAYEFTKATAAITGAFTLTADPDEISGGILLSLGSFIITASGATTKRASTALASAATLTATGADKNMGEAVLFTAFTFSATSRVVYPIRPTASLSMAFSVAATSNRFRSSQVPMTSAWTFANGVTRALKSGVVSMNAFDTVLSAGKIIEFLTENTIVVTEEQRRLRVALESTVLLVQMANGVNTITAEPTDIVVPQEQGRLLAQYNIPTN